MDNWFIFGMVALFLWGLWAFFPKLATNYLNPKSILIFQTLGGLLICIAVLISVNFRPEIHTKGITFAVLAGLAGAIGGLFFLYSISKGKAAIVITMTALYPLVTIILSFLILKEPITIKQGIGMLLALIAMVLLSR